LYEDWIGRAGLQATTQSDHRRVAVAFHREEHMDFTTSTRRRA
jgi:hypothetical protein